MKSGVPSRKKQNMENGISSNGWMTTFSDLVTLLLTFFVLLFSLSSMDDKKLKISFQHFNSSAGFLSFRDYREITSPRDVMIEGLNRMLGEKVIYGEKINPEEGLIPDIDPSLLGGSLNIQILEDGVKLVFGEKLLFPPGVAEVRKEMLPVLAKVARFILISGYQAYIDGHTDNTPVKSEFTSNEEISIARAVNVRYHLMKLEKLSPGAVVTNGYGNLLPVGNNEIAEGRTKNRRIEIILKNQKYF